MQGLSGVSYTGVWWVMQITNLKNDSPHNQDLTPQNSFLEGVQNLSFEHKNNNYYYNFIISIVLHSRLY